MSTMSPREPWGWPDQYTFEEYQNILKEEKETIMTESYINEETKKAETGSVLLSKEEAIKDMAEKTGIPEDIVIQTLEQIGDETVSA